MNRIPALCALLASALLPAISSAAVDMYLQIKDAKGAARVVACESGACVVGGLAAGSCTVLVCGSGAGQNSIAIEYPEQLRRA